MIWIFLINSFCGSLAFLRSLFLNCSLYKVKLQHKMLIENDTTLVID